MHRYLAESGLQVALEELYADLQDVLDHNLEDYLKAIIQTPGLRIADGDEFLVWAENGQFVIRLGSVVFDDYTLFVPPTSQTRLAVDIPSSLISPTQNRDLAAYLKSVTAYSHPYHVAGASHGVYAIGHSAVQLVIQSATTPPPRHSIRLADIKVLDAGFQITDRRLSSQLTMIGDYASSIWDPQSSIAPQPANLTVAYKRLYDHRQTQLEGGAGRAPVDKHSIFTNVREHYVLEVSWSVPPQVEVNALHGLIYYKVLAMPTCEHGEHKISIQTIVPNLPEAGERCGCLIPVTAGCEYDVEVYRVSNKFHHRISAPAVLATPIRVPSPPNCVGACPILNLTSSMAYATRDLIRIKIPAEYSRDRIVRLFAREYVGTPWLAADLMDEKYVACEGPIDDILYMVQNQANDGVTFYAQIIASGNDVANDTQLLDHPFDKSGADWDFMTVVYAPEYKGAGPPAGLGVWPPELPARYLLNQFDLGAPARLVYASTGFVQGSLHDSDKWRPLDPAGATDHTATIVVKGAGGGSAYTWETDGYGASSRAFTDQITLNEDVQVLIQRGPGDYKINPSGLYVVLYFKYEG